MGGHNYEGRKKVNGSAKQCHMPARATYDNINVDTDKAARATYDNINVDTDKACKSNVR